MRPARAALSIASLLFIAATARSDVIYDIQLSPRSGAVMQFNQNVEITFNYRTGQGEGVRIFARPMSAGALSPNYAAHPSPIYPTGSGSGTGSFTITGGDVAVDAIRFQVWNATQSVLLLEFYVPVDYAYSAHALYDIDISPASPSGMQFGQNVAVAFNYRTIEAGGVRIFPRPMTGSALTPNYAASPSPLYAAGSGAGSGSFTIITDSTKVDGIRFQMFNADQSSLLAELIVPVDFDYNAHAIADVRFTPVSPEGLMVNSNVSVSFDYRTADTGGVRIFPRPFTDGQLSTGYAASPSPLYAAGSGSGTGSFTITGGELTVDSVRFQMTSADQSRTLLEYFVPVNFHFAPHSISGIQFSPSSPAYFTHGEIDSSFFTYTTTDMGGVRVFPRPFSGGALSPGYGASPSPLYPTGAGAATGWFTITTGGTVVVDQIRFQMSNAAQTEDLVEWFYPVHFQFGSGVPTRVRTGEAEAPLRFALEQNYPNPFNPSTTIRYELPRTSPVTLEIINMLGQQVALVQSGVMPAGQHEVRFDGRRLSSGMYYYRLYAGDQVLTRKLVLLR